jgi:hypothetical protein
MEDSMFLMELINSQDIQRMEKKPLLIKLTEIELLELILIITLLSLKIIKLNLIFNSLSGMKF